MIEQYEQDAYGRTGEREECWTCNGSGMEYAETCVVCGGYGWTRADATHPASNARQDEGTVV